VTGSDPSLQALLGEATLADPARTDPDRPRLGPDTTAERPPPRRPRGMLDFLLACLLMYGVYAKTPVGALAEWGIRAWVFDQEHSPSLFSTFRGRDSDVQLKVENLEHGVLASQSFPPAIEEAAKRTRVDRELLAVLVASHGRCEGEDCFVTTPPHLDELLERPIDDEEVPVLWVALGLSQGAKRLAADHEVAVEAMFLPPHAVERAIGQARASGLTSPLDVETHATFFAPSLRRGALHDAVSVLALHRLRTLMWPTPDTARTTSPYGYRIHPITGNRKFHNGTDVGVRTGTPLKSAHKGRVGRTGQDSISGKYVHLRHGFGIVSTHCHMSEVRVRQDEPLQRGQVVGLSGATGRVTGPHLHYILRIDGKTVDPEAYGEAPGRHLATDEAAFPQAGLPPAPDAQQKKKTRKRQKPKKKKARRPPPQAATPAATPTPVAAKTATTPAVQAPADAGAASVKPAEPAAPLPPAAGDPDPSAASPAPVEAPPASDAAPAGSEAAKRSTTPAPAAAKDEAPPAMTTAPSAAAPSPPPP
jgi:hypothetical protein